MSRDVSATRDAIVKIRAVLSRARERFPWGRIKPANSDKNGSGDLKSTYEGNSTRAERLAFLILFGLAVEIVAVFILGKDWLESILTVASTALILIGVWGELFFERRAREAGDRMIADAEARAAEALRDAARANLELAKFRSRRTLRPDQLTLIGNRIRSFRPKWDMGIADRNDEEQVNFAAALGNFIHAFWVSQLWKGGRIDVVVPSPGTVGLVMASDVSIQIHPDHEASLRTAGEALASALQEVGIAAAVERYSLYGYNTNNDSIHVLIGPKR